MYLSTLQKVVVVSKAVSDCVKIQMAYHSQFLEDQFMLPKVIWKPSEASK